MTWLKQAFTKPKQSIIGILKQHLGGSYPGRSMKILHASDITRSTFCPRKWAFFDLFEKQPANDFLSLALDITYRMGILTERALIEDWAGDAVIGNWTCRYCADSRTMVPKPTGFCPDGQHHSWQYRQVTVEAPEYDLQGGIDALFNVGAPQLFVTEIKIMAAGEFEQIVLPLPEHRLRTNLYLWLVEHSLHAFKDKINTQEGRVLYVSRGHGKMNTAWNEVLPFKEFEVKRDDGDLIVPLQRAAALKAFRTDGVMPPGICSTALDKIAKQCSVCQQCFSGKFPTGTVQQKP